MVNEFVIARPYVAGRPSTFMEHLLDAPGPDFKREELPVYVLDALRRASFLKVINELGFKATILYAFFPLRNKSKVRFVKTVTAEELSARGVNPATLLEELRAAHLQHNPE